MIDEMTFQNQGSTIWYKISRNSFSNLVSTVVAFAVSLFLLPFIVHHIGLTKFGIWVLVNSLIGYMGLLDAGLAPTLVKKSAEHLAKGEWAELNETVSIVFTLYLLMGALVGALIYGLSFFVPQLFNVPTEDISTFKKVLWIVGLQTALSFPMSIWNGLMGGLQDFHVSNVISISCQLGRVLVTAVLLMLGFGLISLIWLGVCVATFGWLVSIFWIKRRIPNLHVRLSRLPLTKVKDLVRFSGAMLISGIAGRAIQGTDRVIIGLFLPVASISIYEVGGRISNYTRNILYSVLSPTIPAASDLNARNEKAMLQNLYLKGTKYLLILFSALVAILLLFGREFIALWMGKGFEQSVWVMYILIIGNLYQSQNVVADAMLIGIGRLRAYTIGMTIYPILNITLSVLFILRWGLIGVALATTLTIVIIESYFSVYMARILGIRTLALLEACHLPAIVSVIPAILVICYVRLIVNMQSWIGLSMGVAVFSFLFLLSFMAFGLSRYEKEIIKTKVLGTLPFNRA